MTDPTRRVYKYPLQLASGPQTVELPFGAEVVHVQAQDDRPTLWCDVNTSAPTIRRTYGVFATGEPVDVGAKYVGTVHVGWTVWHIFQLARVDQGSAR